GRPRCPPGRHRPVAPSGASAFCALPARNAVTSKSLWSRGPQWARGADSPLDRGGVRVTAPPLLAVEDLRVAFEGDRGLVTQAVAGVSFVLARGRTLGIVGESGCGKSVTALAIMRLLPRANTQVSGAVLFEGHDLGRLPERS